MALTTHPQNSPLSQLRSQGLNVDLSRARLRVAPRQKITPDIQTFITTNLLSVVDELHLENYYKKTPDPLGYAANNDRDLKVGGGCLFWSVDDTTRAELGAPVVDFRDVISDSENGTLTQ